MGVDGPIAGEADQESKRSEKRARVLLTARIRAANGVEEDVRLRDLSRKGALIE